MLIAVITAPVLLIAVKVPLASVRVWLRMILLFMLSVTTAAELLIPVNPPVPALVPEMILLLDISSVPDPAELTIPLYTEAAVPYTEQF